VRSSHDDHDDMLRDREPGRRARASHRTRKLAIVAVLLLGFAPFGLLQRHGEGDHHGSNSHGSRLQDAVDRAQRALSGNFTQAAAARPQSDLGTHGFANPLRIPPLLTPRTDSAGRKVFDLTIRPGISTFRPGTRTETWGVNGAYLGPTLRASSGDRVLIHVSNRLPEATTMHWHGMHLPAVADGGPHQAIEPGTTWSPTWTIGQPAATLWYHPHARGATAAHVYRGVAGVFIVSDDAAARLALPKTYGVDDIPVIIQDKRFHEDGSLDLSPHGIRPTGLLGDRILVNGTSEPQLRAVNARLRLRLLNASNARVYNIGFADNRAFDLIATDAGLIPGPRGLTRIQLSPGERAEIVAAFKPRERVRLRSFPPTLGTIFLSALTGAEDSFDLLQIRAAPKLASSPTVPRRLTDASARRPSAATRIRHFELGEQLTINGRKMDMSRVDEVVASGSTEIWEVHNGSPLPHNFHVHGVSFHVIRYAGGPPPAPLTGPKDTVYVPPDATVRLLARFGTYADPAHPFMFHCHLLQDEDHGMMGQFVVVKASRAGAMPPEHHHGHRHH
jgi:FtsP/CotA-like multicopper oxidase with cupredoxin domain